MLTGSLFVIFGCCISLGEQEFMGVTLQTEDTEKLLAEYIIVESVAEIKQLVGIC